MGWDGVDDTAPKAYISDTPLIYRQFKRDMTSKNEKINRELKNEDTLTIDPSDVKEEIINANTQKLQVTGNVNVIKLSDLAQRKIVSEPLFEEFFERTEKKIRAFIETKEPGILIDVQCDQDEESPSRDKCVIQVHSSSNIDFKQRMKLSTIIDITIRREIKALKNAPNGNLQYFQNLNRNLFVHVDL